MGILIKKLFSTLTLLTRLITSVELEIHKIYVITFLLKLQFI